MYRIINKDRWFVRFTEIDNEKINVVRAEMVCDSVEDLPAADDISGCILDMGSIAYIIATGDIYVINSSGEWNNSNGSASGGSKSLTLNNPAKGQKIDIEQPEEKELEILETKEEGEEEDEELIRDPEDK